VTHYLDRIETLLEDDRRLVMASAESLRQDTFTDRHRETSGLLGAVFQQREATLEALSGERQAILAALHEERQRILDRIARSARRRRETWRRSSRQLRPGGGHVAEDRGPGPRPGGAA
jgi:hypothetical protein